MATDFNRTTLNSITEEPSNFDFFRILKIMLKNIVWILLVCIVCISIMVVLSRVTFNETYTSEGSFLVNPKAVTTNEELEETMISSSSLYLSTQLASTYKELLLSDSVMNMAIDDCNLKMTAQELKEFVAIDQKAGTGIIQVSVTTSSAQLSNDIVLSLLEILPAFVNEKLGFGKVEKVDSPISLPIANRNKNTMTYPLIGLLAGLLLSFLFCCFKDLFSNTIKSRKDIQRKIGTNLLVTIPYKARRSRNEKDLLIDSAHSQFDFVEAYKLLRIKTEAIMTSKNIKKILVTSTYQNEGKTTVAVNLAISLAQNGKRVAVIDADLRCPSIGKALYINTDNKSGLSDYLCGDSEWNDVVKYVKSHDFFVVLSGRPCENPSELLNGKKMNDFLNRLEKEFDYIIFDTPPEKVVADAMVVTSNADAALVVIKQDFADIDDINGVIDDINSDGVKVIGCVYNSYNTFSKGKYGKKSKKYYDRYSLYDR